MIIRDPRLVLAFILVIGLAACSSDEVAPDPVPLPTDAAADHRATDSAGHDGGTPLKQADAAPKG